MCEGSVTYTIRGNGESVRELDPIPLCSVFVLDVDANKIKEYRAYIDITPLFLALGLDITTNDAGAMIMIPRNKT